MYVRMYVCVYLCKHLHVVCMYYVRTVIVGQVGRECPPTVAALTDGKVSVACQHTTTKHLPKFRVLTWCAICTRHVLPVPLISADVS